MNSVIGRSIGRYRILEQTGQGGMAYVYKALDTQLERVVALKIVRSEVFPPNIVHKANQRFLREAKALAQLVHSNIVKVYDYGEFDGSPYIVMEYLPGGTLREQLGTPMPVADALELILPVAKALEHAHSRGILHRDVKPANILINENHEPVLTDFGIAKLLDFEEGSTLTGSGMGIGTPAYMAPEQGLGKEVDARADQYSLGVVLYELLTGSKPYTAETPMALVLKQMTDPLPRPSKIIRNFPVEIERVLVKALSKDAEKRFADMTSFIRTLEKYANKTSSITPKVVPVTEAQPQWEETMEGSIGIDPPAPLHPAPKPQKQPTAAPAPQTKQAQNTDGKKTNWKYLPLILILFSLCSVGIYFAKGILDDVLSATNALSQPPAQRDNSVRTTAVAVSTIPPSPVPPTSLPPVTTPQPTPSPTFALIDSSVVAEQGKVLRSVKVGNISAVAYAPGGGSIAVGTDNGTIIFSESNLKPQADFPSAEPIRALSWSPDQAKLATVDQAGYASIWDIDLGTRVLHWQLSSDPIQTIKWSPDGEKIAIGGINQPVTLWNASDGKKTILLKVPSLWVNDLAWSPDGLSLADCEIDGTIRVWDVNTGSVSQTIQAHEDQARVLSWSDNGDLLASAGWDQALQIWDPKKGAILNSKFFMDRAAIHSLDWAPDGQTLILGFETGEVSLVNVSSFKETILSDKPGPEMKVDWSPRGDSFVYAAPNGALTIFGLPER